MQGAVKMLMQGQVATMMAVVAVAGQVVEGLVKKGVLSVEDGQSILSAIAEEIRDDGDADQGQTSDSSYRIAAGMDERAMSVPQKFTKKD